jgi:hypothetical protein
VASSWHRKWLLRTSFVPALTRGLLSVFPISRRAVDPFIISDPPRPNDVVMFSPDFWHFPLVQKAVRGHWAIPIRNPPCKYMWNKVVVDKTIQIQETRASKTSMIWGGLHVAALNGRAAALGFCLYARLPRL